MSKVNCKDCKFYHNGRCETLGEYTSPGELECSWFAKRMIKKLESLFGTQVKPKETLFYRITASPEVLALEFVDMMYDRVAGDYRYYSMLTGEFYNSREEAIAATVEKLKEVENASKM